ncbi:MAG: 30S ribosomal protein S21 [Verrucomicrobia bacterium]|nr:30S ribosomal protein S21 [Verrucomicrobiota bacterium]
MPQVKVRIGESIEKALRLLKKKVDKEQILKTARKQRFAAKPSVKKREKSKAARKYFS